MSTKKRFYTNILFTLIFLIIFLSIIELCSAQIENEDYKISDSRIDKKLMIGKFEEHVIRIENKKNNQN